MKLISMLDYIFQLGESPMDNDSTCWLSCCYYAEFLNQPIKKGMFIPCDEDDNVIEKPTDKEMEKFEGLQYGDFELDYTRIYNYQEAKERVLFEDFDIANIFIQGKKYQTIENKNTRFYRSKWVKRMRLF